MSKIRLNRSTDSGRYLRDSNNPRINFIVFGRPEAFYPYINYHNKKRTSHDFQLLESMNPPNYKSYSDIKVRFDNWIAYAAEKRNDPTILKDSVEIYAILTDYLDKYPYLRYSFLTAANSGNVIDYAISEQKLESKFGLNNEGVLREQLVGGILKRNKDTHKRPAKESLNHEEYEFMIAQIAAHYVFEDKVDENGWFIVGEEDELRIEINGKRLKFKVRNVLDRSGLIDIRPTSTNFLRYRFEPFWLHKYYLEIYNKEIEKRKTAANKVQNDK